MNDLANVKAARDRERKAREAYHKLVEATFREGDRVYISFGRGNYPATVAPWRGHVGSDCAYGERVWVVGVSGKGYPVDASRIVNLVHAQGASRESKA